MEKEGVEVPICTLCGEESELVEHMLLLCEWMRGIWFNYCCGLKIENE